MTSIKKNLSRYLSLSVSIFLIAILLATDFSVDTWISKEFDRAMINKASLLTTLISEDAEEIDFDFADEFMPEFSGKKDPEYFQLWHKGKTFERSKTLDLFKVNELPIIDVPLHTSKIVNIVLPDGRSGRMIVIKFIPQVDSDIREEFGISIKEFSKTQQPMELAYAVSNEELNQILWFVDIIFIISSISAVMVVRIIVSKVVDKGLMPLDELNSKIKEINLNSDLHSISTNNLPEELIPIANGINHFLSENKALYSREKRIASDIAHELKTPIAELLNLSDVALKFPHEKHIVDNYTTEVLSISQRLKSIVNGILLLQKSSSATELPKQTLNINEIITAILLRENKEDRKITLTINKGETLFTNEFAIDTILTNLISNALFYSPADTDISITVAQHTGKKKIEISILNTSAFVYSESDLEHFCEPLWQKDASRTSSQRYGLGLAIVKSYCEKLDATLNVKLELENKIQFTVSV